MKSAVFVSAGIGNALLSIPLIKWLSSNGHSVDLIGTGDWSSEQIFNGFEHGPWNEIRSIGSTSRKIKTAFYANRKYDQCYIDFFGANRKNLLLANMISKQISTNHIPESFPGFLKRKINFIEPKVPIHEGLQYLRLAGDDTLNEVHEKDFSLAPNSNLLPESLKGRNYITIQLGSGNNLTPWKSWPVKRWAQVIEHILDVDAAIEICLIGDLDDKYLTDSMLKSERIIDLIGVTEMAALPAIIGSARVHLGNESGLMHLAGVVGTPSVSIWSVSDPRLFGWEAINAAKHKILIKKPSCWPCYRWIEPNTSRVSHPANCPDFACLMDISTVEVCDEFDELWASENEVAGV